MITVVDKRCDKEINISTLSHIPHKGDIFLYSDESTTIRGVVCKVEYKVVGGDIDFTEYITISVY